MHHEDLTKIHAERANPALTEPTFISYCAGYLDGVADTTENNMARAEHSARIFYAMTAEDADRRHLNRCAASVSEITQARRAAAEWAREHCTYQGGPVNFWTGRPLRATKGSTA